MECSLRKGPPWRGLLVLGSLAAPGAALAADNGLYIGLASSDIESDYDLGPAALDADDERGFKGIVGFRPVDSFAIEANYVDLGETRVPFDVVCAGTPCPNEVSVDSDAISVSAVGMVALPFVDLFARVGYAQWESDVAAAVGSLRRDGSDATYGAGAQVRVGSFALRFEYERFELGDDSTDLVSVGFTYTLF